MVWIWLGVVISLLLTEYLSKNFTAICFAISGFISCSLTYFTNNYMIQLGEFLVVGILLLVFSRPYCLKIIKKFEKKPQKNKINSKDKIKENIKKK